MRKSVKPSPDARYTIQLGSRIREPRKARRWTQRYLASLVHLSESQISKYEAGANSPHPLTLLRLAHTFGLPVDAVLPETEGVPREPVERELHERLRELIALPSREKEAALGLLRILFGFRLLLLENAGRPPRAPEVHHGAS
jgi:transcriptional regulator with XRE-family HTH domain